MKVFTFLLLFSKKNVPTSHRIAKLFREIAWRFFLKIAYIWLILLYLTFFVLFLLDISVRLNKNKQPIMIRYLRDINSQLAGKPTKT